MMTLTPSPSPRSGEGCPGASVFKNLSGGAQGKNLHENIEDAWEDCN